MPRRSILREVQEAAYAPKKKPSPAPLVLGILLPVLLVPTIIPIIELISGSPSPTPLDLTIATPESALPDLTISLTPGGLVTTNYQSSPFSHHDLPASISSIEIDAPTILLFVDSTAKTADLIAVLETLNSCSVGKITFSSESPSIPSSVPASPRQLSREPAKSQ